MKYIFTTKLSPAECVTWIKNNSHESTFLNKLSTLYQHDKNIFYKFRGNKFRLEQIIHNRNSFKPYFYGELVATPHGTRIEGEFHILRFVQVFMFIWFIGVFFIGGTLFLLSLNIVLSPEKNSNYSGNPLIGLLSFPGFLLFGIGIMYIGKIFGMKNKKAILEFIKRVCMVNKDLSKIDN